MKRLYILTINFTFLYSIIHAYVCIRKDMAGMWLSYKKRGESGYVEERVAGAKVLPLYSSQMLFKIA